MTNPPALLSIINFNHKKLFWIAVMIVCISPTSRAMDAFKAFPPNSVPISLGLKIAPSLSLHAPSLAAPIAWSGYSSHEASANAKDRDVIGKRFNPLWIAVEGALIATDETTIKWFDPNLNRADKKEGFAKSVSHLAEPQYMLVPAIALYASGTKGRSVALKTATAVADASILTAAVKYLAGRERPNQSGGKSVFHGPSAGNESFPSGHSTAAWASATVLGDSYPRYKSLFYLLAAGVGWSRMDQGKHFLSDVVGGAIIGVASGRRTLQNGHGFFNFSF